jgi:hypothetical protein
MCKRVNTRQPLRSAIFRATILLVGVLGPLAGLGAVAFAAEPGQQERGIDKSSCVECHADPKFLVQNKKLYDYFQAWQVSIHMQTGVTCSDCHGGNPKTKTKEAAHGSEPLRASDAASPINYRNIPATCAKCHNTIYEKYRQSKHFEHLKATAQEEQGPNCVTCHGSLNTRVLTVANVRQACQRCHNERTQNSPEIPAQAESVLNNFLSIDRYYRFVATRSTPEDAKSFAQFVDPVIKRLKADWHTFDIDAIDEKTHDLVQFMKVRRNDVLNAERSKRK